MSKPFDDKALMDQVDGDLEFLQETLAMFDEDSGELLEKIRADAAARDAASLAKSAHLMKGMLANFCAEPAETAARELETMARENRLADGEAAAERLQMETERLAEALHTFARKQMK